MLVIRIVAAIGFLAVAAFCGFGFMATFEPPGSLGLRIAYGLVGLTCAVATMWLLVAVRRP